MPTLTSQSEATPTETQASFQRYYEEAGPDYAAWSPHFNMHFGFFRRGLNPFNREAMLEEMNAQIFLRLRPSPNARILDLGCGLAATLRSFARRLPAADLHGITLVPWQLQHGRALNAAHPATRGIHLTLADYQRTPFPSASFDAVYACESACYAHGPAKSAFLAEAFRLLRPGARLVIADGFLGPGKLRGPQRAICRKLCDCWVIETLGEVDQVAAEMHRLGFRDIAVEQIQARVTPSVLQVPFVTLAFLLRVLRSRRRMTPARWNNVLAPVLLPFVGYPLGPMAYYLLSATKP